MLNRSQRNFAHVTTVTLSWHVQNFVVISRVHFKPEHCKFWSNFEFDRNIVSGTGACWHWSGSSLVHVMASCLLSTKPLPKPILILLSIAPLGTHINMKCNKNKRFWIPEKSDSKRCLQNDGPGLNVFKQFLSLFPKPGLRFFMYCTCHIYVIIQQVYMKYNSRQKQLGKDPSFYGTIWPQNI